MVFFSCF